MHANLANPPANVAYNRKKNFKGHNSSFGG